MLARRLRSPPGAVAAAFAAEANGLRWLAEAAAVPVPDVLAVGPEALVISMIPPGPATPEGGLRVRQLDLALAARGRSCDSRRAVAGVHRQPAAGQHAYPGGLAAVVRAPQAAAVPDPGRGRGRAAVRGRSAGGGGRRPDRLAGRACGAAEPDHGDRWAAGRCRGPAAGAGHRPRGARRPPRDRPGHAVPVRRACPGPDPGRAIRTRSRWRRAGGPGSRCTSCTRCWCTRACSAPRTGRRSGPRPVPP